MATTKSIKYFRNDRKGYTVGDMVRFKNEDGTPDYGEIINMIEHLKTGGRGQMVGDQFAEIKRDNGTTCHRFKDEIISRLIK